MCDFAASIIQMSRHFNNSKLGIPRSARSQRKPASLEKGEVGKKVFKLRNRKPMWSIQRVENLAKVPFLLEKAN